MNELTHLDLFSGIGGFALAAQWAGFRTVGFCEWEPFCQDVLRKHWPDVPIHGDIRELDGSQYKGVELLTGGFPCQPFSSAGKQKGKADDRFLWPEMFRVIKESKPSWIVGENVAGIVNMALDQVLSELDSYGYSARAFIIPACAVNATHRRDRVWIVANAYSDGRLCDKQTVFKEGGIMVNDIITNGTANRIGEEVKNTRDEWEIQAVGSPILCGKDDGIPHRVDRIKALGNAIVPQVAFEIIKNLKKG